jgi:hypothetical protein
LHGHEVGWRKRGRQGSHRCQRVRAQSAQPRRLLR